MKSRRIIEQAGIVAGIAAVEASFVALSIGGTVEQDFQLQPVVRAHLAIAHFFKILPRKTLP